MSIRAVRNNNPGNIRVGINWHGLMDPAHMTPEQHAETAFCVFQNAVEGFRAMATIFHTYHREHKINTLRLAISRWAPPSENNTGAYVNDVCGRLQHGPDDPYDFDAGMVGLCKVVSIHEVGSWAFSDADLHAGVAASH